MKEQTIYVTDDGRTFSSSYEAARHEVILRVMSEGISEGEAEQGLEDFLERDSRFRLITEGTGYDRMDDLHLERLAAQVVR